MTLDTCQIDQLSQLIQSYSSKIEDLKRQMASIVPQPSHQHEEPCLNTTKILTESQENSQSEKIHTCSAFEIKNGHQALPLKKRLYHVMNGSSYQAFKKIKCDHDRAVEPILEKKKEEPTESSETEDSSDEEFVPTNKPISTSKNRSSRSKRVSRSIEFIKWRGRRYLLKSDLAIAVGMSTKFVPEVKAARYNKLMNQPAFITLDESYYKELKKLHSGVRSSQFRVLGMKSGQHKPGAKREIRLYTEEFMNYLRRTESQGDY